MQEISKVIVEIQETKGPFLHHKKVEVQRLEVQLIKKPQNGLLISPLANQTTYTTSHMCVLTSGI